MDLRPREPSYSGFLQPRTGQPHGTSAWCIQAPRVPQVTVSGNVEREEHYRTYTQGRITEPGRSSPSSSAQWNTLLFPRRSEGTSWTLVGTLRKVSTSGTRESTGGVTGVNFEREARV